jgi:hypothetical protein
MTRTTQTFGEYCAMETLGMVQIVDQIKRLTSKQPD